MASRVLVIDDSTTLRKLVEIAMRGTGIDIDFAATGSDGVMRARAAKPDVILLDYLLPDLESTEVVQLLSDDSNTAQVPVVVMSANEISIFDSFRDYPAVVDFVGKPFTPAVIRARLESAIRGERPAPRAPVKIEVAPRSRSRATFSPPLADGSSDELTLRGSLMSTPVLEVLRLLAMSNATGTLTIDLAEPYRIHIRRGEVVMVTKTHAQPALIAAAHAGTARVAELPIELHRESTRFLDEVLGAQAGKFHWIASMALPDHVEAFGRPLSVTSVALARQRRTPHEMKLSPKFLDEIYDRTPRFSEKLAGARLEPEEQRLLALIDGRTTVREILSHTKTSSDRAASVFARLRNVDLIRSEGTSGITDTDGGAVAVLDDDHAGFIASVRAHLGKRAQPIDTITIDKSRSLAQAVLKARVRMVLINAKLCTPEIVANELSPIATAGTIGLVAVLDAPSPGDVDAMIKAGMHAVLVKPIHVNDLERLLTLP